MLMLMLLPYQILNMKIYLHETISMSKQKLFQPPSTVYCGPSLTWSTCQAGRGWWRPASCWSPSPPGTGSHPLTRRRSCCTRLPASAPPPASVASASSSLSSSLPHSLTSADHYSDVLCILSSNNAMCLCVSPPLNITSLTTEGIRKQDNADTYNKTCETYHCTLNNWQISRSGFTNTGLIPIYDLLFLNDFCWLACDKAMGSRTSDTI